MLDRKSAATDGKIRSTTKGIICSRYDTRESRGTAWI